MGGASWLSLEQRNQSRLLLVVGDQEFLLSSCDGHIQQPMLLLTGGAKLLEGEQDHRPLETFSGMDGDEVDSVRIFMGSGLCLLHLVIPVFHAVLEDFERGVETLGHHIIHEGVSNIVFPGILGHLSK